MKQYSLKEFKQWVKNSKDSHVLKLKSSLLQTFFVFELMRHNQEFYQNNKPLIFYKKVLYKRKV